MTPRELRLTSVGPEGSMTCGLYVGVGAVRGVFWLVVAPQPTVAMALNKITLRITDMAESSTLDQSNVGAGMRYGWGVTVRARALSRRRTSSSDVWSNFKYHCPTAVNGSGIRAHT